MGKRKKRGWTHNKKHATAASLEPTEKQWEKLERFEILSLQDDENGQENIYLSDNIAIVPHVAGSCTPTALPVEDYWIAKIKDIRATPEGEVWLKVNWYYTHSDLLKYVPTFKPSSCAKFERVYSHHSEIISSTIVAQASPVFRFLENNTDQKPIPANSFFCRYYFDATEFSVGQYTSEESVNDTRDAKRNINISVCDLCRGAYSPEDPDPDEVQHWCPSPSCRRGFHRRCLQKHDLSSDSSPGDLIRARLANLPDPGGPDKTDSDTIAILTLKTLKSVLPASLLVLAAQPLVRGGGNVSEHHGVAGNIAMIVHARRVVHAALRQNDYLDTSTSSGGNVAESGRLVDEQLGVDLELDNWEDDPAFEGWEDAIVEDINIDRLKAKSNMMLLLRCPNCAKAM
ncbi:hypothetical protein C8F01DRAFT_346799 [Mycena amicta]|nr:hypothetical protein C8F01DRAFT_346799 [Mycena amicta]